MSQNDDPTQPGDTTPPPFGASVPPPPQDATPQYQTPSYQAPQHETPATAGGYQQAGQQGSYPQPGHQQGGYQQGAYQQGAYPQAQYPGGQQYGAYQPGQPSRNNGLAIAALVVGIISVLISFIPFVNFAAILGGIAALVMGILAMRKARTGEVGGKGMAITGLVLGAVSVIISAIVLIATFAFFTALPTTVEDALEEAAESSNGGTLSEDEQADAAASALALGETAEIGDYTVAVTEVTQDATDVVADANEFNAEADGQYVVVRLEVEYTGSDEGTPWIDLQSSYVGTDNRQYSSSTCSAVIPENAMEVPTLNNGGAASYNLCMDVPPDAIAGGQVFVEELFSFTETRVYWDVQ